MLSIDSSADRRSSSQARDLVSSSIVRISCRQVDIFLVCSKKSAGQFRSLPLCALFILLLLQCTSAIKLLQEREAEPMYSRFLAYDGNMPAKFFHAESPLTAADWTVDQSVTRYEDSNQKEMALETDSSAEENVDVADGTSTKQDSTENRRTASLVTLPLRERRLTWNRWMEWFRPLKSINRSPVHSPLRFLPVRGRKTTFIAARGKKSTLKGQSKSLVDPVKLHLASPLKANYYLVAVVLKRLP